MKVGHILLQVLYSFDPFIPTCHSIFIAVKKRKVRAWGTRQGRGGCSGHDLFSGKNRSLKSNGISIPFFWAKKRPVLGSRERA